MRYPASEKLEIIRTKLKSCLQAGTKGLCQTAIAAVPNNVMNAKFAGDFRSAIGATVVNHQKLDDINASYLARQSGKCVFEVPGFIEGRYLDDELSQ